MLRVPQETCPGGSVVEGSRTGSEGCQGVPRFGVKTIQRVKNVRNWVKIRNYIYVNNRI